MPKLPVKMRKQVDSAQAVSGDFDPLSPGKYVATLSSVEAKKSSAGNPMWVAEFENIRNLEGEKQPGRQWYNLNLPTTDTPPDDYPKTPEKWVQFQDLCRGRLKAFFEAFGYTTDSDTDEMIGDDCVLSIAIRTIQSGPRAGETTNSVNGVKPLDSVDFEGGDDEEEDDEF